VLRIRASLLAMPASWQSRIGFSRGESTWRLKPILRNINGGVPEGTPRYKSLRRYCAATARVIVVLPVSGTAPPVVALIVIE
jgi:hypothetical protein